MVSSTKNNRPTNSTSSTTSTQKTEGPQTTSAPTPEELDAGQSIEELTGTSTEPAAAMDRGMSVQPPTTQATLSRPQTTAQKVVSSDPTGVANMVVSRLDDLKPGESVVVGAKADGLVDGIALAGEGSIEIERRKDGKFAVTIGVGGGVGVGAETDQSFGKTGATGGFVAHGEMVFVVDNAADAAKLAAEGALAMAAPGGPDVLRRLNSDDLDTTKIEVGFGMELSAELKLQNDKSLGGGFTGEVTAGIVIEEPGQAYLELKGEAELEGEAAFSDVGVGGASTKGTLTVRVPIGRVDDVDLLDPEARQRLVADARARGREGLPSGTTMTMQVEVSGSPALGAGVTLETEKTVQGNRLADLRGPGWETRVAIDFGVRPSFPLGNASVEVEAAVSKNAYTSSGGSLDEEIKKAERHAPEIEAKAKAVTGEKKKKELKYVRN